MITLEGIVLYSLCPSLSRSFSYSRAASLSRSPTPVSGTRPSNRDLRTFSRGDEPLLRFFFFSSLSFLPSVFKGKRNTTVGGRSTVSVALSRCSQLFFAMLLLLLVALQAGEREGGKGFVNRGKKRPEFGSNSSVGNLSTPMKIHPTILYSWKPAPPVSFGNATQRYT